MTALPAPSHLFVRAAIALACTSLVACGGGGGADALATAAPEVNAAAPAPQPAASTAAEAASTATATASSPATIEAAMAQSTPEAASASAVAEPQPSPLSKTAAVDAQVEAPLMKIEAVSTAAAAPMVTTAGAVYYIDSVAGSDANNGLAASAGTGGVGPWRSLAKLAAAALKPGDSVRLICGSVWNETLRLSSSGAMGSPINVSSYPAGCSNAPAIDGSVSLAPAVWSLHKGSIYKATLATAPLQVFNTSGAMSLAHHPNAGFDPAQPQSVYLRNASVSDSVLLNGRTVSSYVTTGSDLVLPTGATVTAGTKIRIRTLPWLMDERTVSAVSGTRLTLDTPTSYKLDAGWGYFLLGQLWMLDSPGEWHYDGTAKLIYAWMPDSKAPATPVQVTQLATGIDLSARAYVNVDNLAVRKVKVGVDLRSSSNVAIRGARIEDTLEHGIYAIGSASATVSGSVLARTGTDAISAQEDSTAAATGLQVLNNTLTDIGVVMSGNTQVSLPGRSRAAIRAGTNALVDGNSLTNTGYIGIWAGTGSVVSNNTISGACSVLDDCGAIYASGANNNSTISNNLVVSPRGALAGKAPALSYTQAQGIYLDESASGVTVSGNTVTGADNGVQLHVAANNVIKNNKLYGNRISQLWMQENANRVNPSGDVFGNTVSGNQIVATSPTARGLYLESSVTDTLHFGSFDFNRYLDTVYPTMAEESSPLARTPYTLTTWRAATASGVPRLLDANGSGTSQTKFAAVVTTGGNIVPNGSLAVDLKGWTKWNATAPYGTLTRESCAPGWCARYAAGGSPGLVSSPNFSVVAGTWYRLTIDAAAGADAQLLNIVVRRGGGGSNGYESLSDRSLNVVAYRSFRRYSVIFKAIKTINAGDPITGDLGARVDVQNIATGQTVSVSNLELVPIVQPDAFTRSDILVNTGSAATQAVCPVASTQPSLCSNYVRLSDNQVVIWPYYLAPRSSEIVYTRDASLVDSDGDGIPDQQDACPATPAGASVNARGCALGQ